MRVHLREVDEHEGEQVQAGEERAQPQREAEEDLDCNSSGEDALDVTGDDGDLCCDPQEARDLWGELLSTETEDKRREEGE
jgi:hypothetical protein